MIETNNPGINVDELMQKIREEVARRQETVKEDTRISIGSAISAEINNIEFLLNDAEFNSQVPTKFPDKLNRFPFNISKRLQRLSLKLYGFIFKKQRVVNLPLIQAVRDSLALNRQLIEQVTALQVQVNVMGDHITTTQQHLSGMGDRITGTEKQVNRTGDRLTVTQKQVNQISDRITVTQEHLSGISDRLTATVSHVSEMDAQITATQEHLSGIGDRITATVSQVSEIGDRITATESQMSEIGDRITATESQMSEIGDRITATESQVSGMGDHITATESQVSGMGDRITATESQVSGMGDRITATESQVSGMGDRITATESQVSGMGDRITATESQVSGMGDRITATESQVSGMGDHITATEERLSGIGERLSAIDERYTRNDSYLKNDLAQQKRLITLFLEEARLRLPEPFSQEQVQTLVNEEQHLLDAFYVAFEDRFRGSREEIIGRLIVYLPLIQKAKVGTQSSPILDVGCGRGEWLELLRQAGYTAHGLDMNRVMIEQCRVRGLEVAEGDVISYLQSLPDASLGAVTGFHIIEHLPFSVLIKLLNETLRVLKPGGLAIFETPNPQNMLVGSNNFYMDPTHLNPLPNLLTKFLFENTGFQPVEVMNLHPYPESFKVSGSEIAERFNDYFYGPQDYAVFGYKI